MKWVQVGKQFEIGLRFRVKCKCLKWNRWVGARVKRGGQGVNSQQFGKQFSTVLCTKQAGASARNVEGKVWGTSKNKV